MLKKYILKPFPLPPPFKQEILYRLERQFIHKDRKKWIRINPSDKNIKENQPLQQKR